MSGLKMANADRERGAPGHRIYDVSIYTMSLFIAGLALKNDLLGTTKLGILIASATAAAPGITAL
jgi:Na+/H+ antiporter NhaA